MARIAVIGHTHYPIAEPYAGGLERHTSLMCRMLVAQGHNVVLFAAFGSTDNGFDVEPITPEGFKFHPYPKDSSRGHRQSAHRRQLYFEALQKVDDSFDFVINNSLNPATLEWQSPIPMLTIFHTPVLWELIEPVRAAARRNDRAFCAVSTSCADDWRRFVPHVEVVANGIEASAWKPSPRLTDELRWSARLVPEKGTHLAIDAAQRTGRTLRLAGTIGDAEYFEQCVQPRLNRHVIYEGHLNHNDLVDFLGTGAVSLVTPVWDEPFGLTVLEALACGTPVAAFPRGVMSELIPAGVGAVATRSTAPSLKRAIDRAVECQRADCVRWAHEFSALAMVKNYLRLIGELPYASVDVKDSADEQPCVAG